MNKYSVYSNYLSCAQEMSILIGDTTGETGAALDKLKSLQAEYDILVKQNKIIRDQIEDQQQDHRVQRNLYKRQVSSLIDQVKDK